MGYGLLEVSEVGPPEYPLIGVLHESVFRRPQEMATLGGGAADLLTLMAHLEGNPVGYLVGAGGAGGARFVVESIAVLPDYQRQGLGARMLEWAEQHAQARGYESIEINASAPCPHALERLAARRGFVAAGDSVFTRRPPGRRPSP